MGDLIFILIYYFNKVFDPEWVTFSKLTDFKPPRIRNWALENLSAASSMNTVTSAKVFLSPEEIPIHEIHLTVHVGAAA